MLFWSQWDGWKEESFPLMRSTVPLLGIYMTFSEAVINGRPLNTCRDSPKYRQLANNQLTKSAAFLWLRKGFSIQSYLQAWLCYSWVIWSTVMVWPAGKQRCHVWQCLYAVHVSFLYVYLGFLQKNLSETLSLVVTLLRRTSGFLWCTWVLCL